MILFLQLPEIAVPRFLPWKTPNLAPSWGHHFWWTGLRVLIFRKWERCCFSVKHAGTWDLYLNLVGKMQALDKEAWVYSTGPWCGGSWKPRIQMAIPSPVFALSDSMLGNLTSGFTFALYKSGLDTFKVTEFSMDLSSSSATLTSVKSITSLMAFCFLTRPKGPTRTSESSLLHMTFKPLYHLSPASFVNCIMTTFSASATLNSSKTKFSLSLSWEHASTLTTWQTSIHPSTLTSNLVFFDIPRWADDSCLWGPTLPGHMCFTLAYWSMAAFPTWTWASLFHGVYWFYFSVVSEANSRVTIVWSINEGNKKNLFKVVTFLLSTD